MPDLKGPETFQVFDCWAMKVHYGGSVAARWMLAPVALLWRLIGVESYRYYTRVDALAARSYNLPRRRYTRPPLTLPECAPMGRIVVSSHPLIRHKVTLLRDQTTESRKFRDLIREITILLAYEATADLALSPLNVQTPLAMTEGAELAERIGLVPVLRAGLGMVNGIWELMPQAEVWHIGLYRDEKTLQPVEYYNRLPEKSTVQVCLVLDPMLATGGSASATVDILKRWGAGRIKYLGIIGAPEGVKTLSEAHPDVEIYLAALDTRLTPEPQKPGDPPRGFIVPGLGDAGDRQFGTG